MQVFWVYVFFFYLYNNNVFFFASVCFLLTSDSFFCMLSVTACLLGSSVIIVVERRMGGNESDKSFAGWFEKKGSQAGGIVGTRGGIINQIESFAILSLHVLFSGRFVLTRYSINALSLSFYLVFFATKLLHGRLVD